MKWILIIASCLISVSQLKAEENPLIIHAAEIGIGKFHRYDNKVRNYQSDNIWLNYALPEGANLDTPRVQNNADGSVTIFYSHLEELLQQIEKTSKELGRKVDVLNINAHGMPGAMWFPMDAKTMKSASCASWVKEAKGDDQGNYDHYYSAVPKSAIMQFRILAKLPSMQWAAPCTTGSKQWTEVMKRNKGVKDVFASDAQIHLFSCVVGLGLAGKNFVNKLATLVLSGDNSKVEASMNFGLGDWSMPEGMGFWDYQNDEQLKHDNALYPVNKEDREMMQKGQIRLAVLGSGKAESGIVTDLDFMYGYKDELVFEKSTASLQSMEDETVSREEMRMLRQGITLRIPGTQTDFHYRLK